MCIENPNTYLIYSIHVQLTIIGQIFLMKIIKNKLYKIKKKSKIIITRFKLNKNTETLNKYR